MTKSYKPKKSSSIAYRPNNSQAQKAARHFGRLSHARRVAQEYVDITPSPADLTFLLSRVQTIHSD